MTAPQRLNALEAAFLKMHATGTPFAVGAMLVYERGPLGLPGGQLDTERVMQYTAAAIDRLPRYRQRMVRIPILGHPVWRDCDAFHIEEHVRFARLASPGTEAQLDELAGRILSAPLPIDRPPWQFWFVDGLAGDRFAVISYMHHALVDGMAGVRLLENILRGVPDTTIPPRVAWQAAHDRPAALLMAELAYRLRGMAALRRSMLGKTAELLPALADLLVRGLRPASDAGLNRKRVGRERVIARWQVPMAEIKRIRRHFEVTVNDVVLAVVTGGLRRFLERRGIDVAELSDFRAMVPASTHDPSDRSVSGNHVAMLLTQLPVDEPDPARRMARIRVTTRALKSASRQVAAGELLVRMSDVSAPSLLAAIMRLSLARRGFNVVITDIPGPPFPLYMLGCRLHSFHPIVNLWPNQILGLAFFSYAGTMYCGLQADRGAVGDLGGLVGDLEASLDELRGLVEVEAPAPARASG